MKALLLIARFKTGGGLLVEHSDGTGSIAISEVLDVEDPTPSGERTVLIHADELDAVIRVLETRATAGEQLLAPLRLERDRALAELEQLKRAVFGDGCTCAAVVVESTVRHQPGCAVVVKPL